jgi:hypothetical protein
MLQFTDAIFFVAPFVAQYIEKAAKKDSVASETVAAKR